MKPKPKDLNVCVTVKLTGNAAKLVLEDQAKIILTGNKEGKSTVVQKALDELYLIRKKGKK